MRVIARAAPQLHIDHLRPRLVIMSLPRGYHAGLTSAKKRYMCAARVPQRLTESSIRRCSSYSAPAFETGFICNKSLLTTCQTASGQPVAGEITAEV